uniref:Uncharacterized protein n=1 Tax=Acrobeloides nanus TaxID=290746 RepID=A0A914E7Q2_9BILA
MNSTKLAIVVLFAVLTGVLVPLACIGMYVCGICSLICRKIRPGGYDDKALMSRREWETYHSSESEGRSRIYDFPQSSTTQSFQQSAYTISTSNSAVSADKLLLVPTSSCMKKSDSNYA